MASSLPPVRVVERCLVSPSRNLPPPWEVSIPLTLFDITWVGTGPIECLFFYQWPGPTAHFVISVLPRLKRSLSCTLQHLYPLAGKLRCPPGSDRFHVYCTDGDTVPFTVAECEGDLRQLAGDHARGIDLFRPLVPQTPPVDAGAEGNESLPLSAFQVTVFPGAGFCLGISIHHAVCDGSGFTGFMKSWSSACRLAAGSTSADQVPFFDPALVSDPDGLYTVFWNEMKRLQGVERLPLRRDGPDMVRSTFLLRRSHIEMLRRRVGERRPLAPPFRYSAFVLACANVWSALLKVRREAAHDCSGIACFIFSVDCRPWLHPPLPATYMGNCLIPCFVEAPWSDLVGEDGVGHAAEAIAREISLLEDGNVLRGAEGWLGKLWSWLHRRPLSVTWSPKFGVYGVDFGWGQPEKVEVMGIERTGAFSLAQSRQEGGIEVGLVLPAPEMEDFRSLFAAGLL